MKLPSTARGSAASLKAAHHQRRLAFALSVGIFTCFAWEVMMSSWTTIPGPRRFFNDLPSLLMAVVCYVFAAFVRYSVSEVAALTASVPSPVQVVVVVVAHTVIGLPLGLSAWQVAVARAGTNLAPALALQSGARGGLIAGGAACGVLSALHFFAESKHQLLVGLLPRPTPVSSFLSAEIAGSLKTGLLAGVVLALGYLALRCLVELLPGQPWRPVLALLLGLSTNYHTGAGETEAGRLVVAYLVFLSTAVTFALHSIITVVMNLIILAPQDFVRLWDASINSASSARQSSWPFPDTPSAMLLDMLSIGHGASLWVAEKHLLDEKRGENDGRTGAQTRLTEGHSYEPGFMGDWKQELELQRRALFLASMATPASSGITTGGVGLPIWAQVAKAQALQSLALRAPCDRELRVDLYNINITQVLRTLCLELDWTNLLVQSIRFREDPSAAARVLGCEGRGDIEWLVQKMASNTSASCSIGSAYRRALQTLKNGFTPPLRETLYGVLHALWPTGDRGRGSRASRRGDAEKSTLSSASAQSAVWAAQGISALMVHAPGESCTLLDAMLPVVLGSLAGLMLALRPGLPEEAASEAGPIDNADSYVRALRSHRMLALELKKALSEVARKYRGCLGEFRFPPAYAELINDLCSM